MAFDVAGAVGAGYSPTEITDYLVSHPDQADGFNVQGALKAGYSPAEVVDHLNPKADKVNVQDYPILAPIDRGIAHLRQQGANLATDLGFPETGSFIRQSIPQATLGAQTSGQQLTDAIKNRDYLSALKNIPNAALEQAVPVGAAVATSGLGGGVMGGLAAGAGIGALSQGDAIARARAANNGRTAPNASDMALGLAGGAGTGAVGALGLGGVGGGVANAVKNVAVHTAADAAQPELTALAGSVGTSAGPQSASVPDMATAGLTGMATRGALAAPALVRGGIAMTPGGQKAQAVADYTAMTPDQQANLQNTKAAGDILQGAKDDVVPMQGEGRQSAVARTAGALLDSRMSQLMGSLDAQGALPQGGDTILSEAWKAAANQQRTLLNQHLGQIDGLGLDPQTTQTIKDTLTQRAMLTDAGVANRGTSMVGKIGGFLGAATGYAAGGLTGGTFVGAHPFVGAEAGRIAGRTIGDAVASRFGLTDPALVKAAANASDMLDANGVAVPDTFQRLQQAIGTQQNVVASQARLMGVPPPQAAATAPQASPVAPMPPTAPPQAAPPAPTPAPALAPTVQGIAAARAAQTPAPKPVTPASDLTAPMPNMDGLSVQARDQGSLLPEWQYGLGKNLADALQLQGTPKPINMAQEVSQAIDNMKARGWFDDVFAKQLMQHNGRVTRGLYNVIRNEMLGNHGIDRRTLDAQASGQPKAQAAE